MLIVQFHCHTCYSRDSLVRPADLVNACYRKGIDRVIVTDHNKIGGALEAQRIDPKLVIVGVEIMTSRGELLAAYVQEEIEPHMEPMETIEQLRQQGAFISVSHPFDRSRKGSWDPDDLLAIIPHVDAIEIFNARCMLAQANQQAQDFARQYRLTGTAGADAHTLFELERAVMVLPEFKDPTSLRQALGQAKYEPRLSSPLIHLTSRWAVWYKIWRKR